MTKKLAAADLFCGAGGTSCGAESTGAARVVFALNHWDIAIQTHQANHPHARHVNSRLDQTSPTECGRIDLLFASPPCTHHSRARGGRPTNNSERSGAWEILPWLEGHRPTWLVVENVADFLEWGPVGRDGRPLPSMKGVTFHSWLGAIVSMGYTAEWRILNSADYGAATARRRLFVIARKARRRIPWPEPTHGQKANHNSQSPWKQAEELIDWNLPARSISEAISHATRPLNPKTIGWIEAGRKRFGQRFLVSYYGNGGPSSVEVPLPTITTRDRFGLVDGDRFRMITPAELQILQGFPAEYKICGSRADQVKQIGNSVSPCVAAAITRAIAGVV
jgi:DNA (cytosine-5)-methyltransferase 1